MNPYFAEQLAAQAAHQRDAHLAQGHLVAQASASRRHRLADVRSRIQAHVARRPVVDAVYPGPVTVRSAC